MPKKIYKIDQFHGGLNTHSEWRDIADNELSRATDVMVNHVGKIKLLGEIQNTSFSIGGQVIAGYGLYTFSSDWAGGEDANDTRIVADGSGGFIAGTEVVAHYIIVYDNNARKLHVYSRATGGGWEDNDTYAYVFPTSNSKPVFYKADGIVRFSDGINGTNYTGTRKWYGHINRMRFQTRDAYNSNAFDSNVGMDDGHFRTYNNTIFFAKSAYNGNASGLSSASQIVNLGSVNNEGLEYNNTWLLTDAEPIPPTSGILCYTDSDGSITRAGVGTITIYPTPGSPAYPTIKLVYATSGDETSGGNGWNKTWDIAYSYIYDGTQETALKKLGSGVPWTGINNAQAKIGIYFKRDASAVLNVRITGVNIYLRETGTDTYYLQAEVDLFKGITDVANQNSVQWKFAYEGTGGTLRYFIATEWIKSPSTAISYTSNTGLPQETETISAHYKTAVVTNRMAYIGNVVYKENGINVTKSDAMMKSFPNRFDTFSPQRVIEASVNDGDEIKKLETYADRILQFKTRKMHLINISQELEFLEDTFIHKGIDNPNATCQTDFGIAWVNKNGCYFYNGKSVENLFEKQNRRLISKEDWDVFYDGTGIQVTYIPTERQLMILRDSDGNYGDVYIYDFVTQSWVFGDSVFGDSIDKTNFTVDYQGNSWIAKQNSTAIVVAEWSSNPASTNTLDLRTKDIDFGFPNTRKKIYKIYITHKNCGINKVRLRAEIMSSKATSGQATGGQLSNWGTFGNFVTDPDLDQQDNWITNTFIPPSTDDGGNAINWSNVYSMRLYISPATVDSALQTVPAGFEINDINIVYRAKSVK
tara:strand:- start:8211 stop:10652 length:2442 start_codon:yes stop_codon:yes gene_type:complete